MSWERDGMMLYPAGCVGCVAHPLCLGRYVCDVSFRARRVLGWLSIWTHLTTGNADVCNREAAGWWQMVRSLCSDFQRRTHLGSAEPGRFRVRVVCVHGGFASDSQGREILILGLCTLFVLIHEGVVRWDWAGNIGGRVLELAR